MAALVGLGLAAALLIADDATGIGAVDDAFLLPIGAAMSRLATSHW